ncbi:HAD hydrolase family protein [Bradyrhizobium sp. RDT10]
MSDVDGTPLTNEKILSGGARDAPRKLQAVGIGFTIVSSRPVIGMGFLIMPLAITLPVGVFNGSCIVDSRLKTIEQHFIPAPTVQRCLDVIREFGIDIWLLTGIQ